MSAEQTRARRLAERLESPPCHRTLTDDDCAEAAAELRRLDDSEAALDPTSREAQQMVIIEVAKNKASLG